MSNPGFKPEYVWDGKYENFPKLQKALENYCYTHGLEFKAIQPKGKINLRGIYVLMLMSNCPAPTVDFLNGWSMKQILDQNDIDRPHTLNGNYRRLLDNFETVVFDQQSQPDVEEFLGEVLGVLMPFFAPNIPDLLNLDRTDPFCTIRLLQSLYTKFLAYASTNSADFTANIFDHARSWTGGGADEFTQFILELQKRRSELPDSLRPVVSEKLLVDLVIASLKKDPNLNAMHAILRSDFIKGQCVTLDNVESAVISILKDITVSTISAAREEPVAATAFFSQQKKRTFPAPRGKPTENQSRSWGNQSRSPIKKTIPRLSSAVWAKMPQEAKDQFLQEKREGQSQQRGSRGGRGRGGRAVQTQRKAADEAEADMAEAEDVECFNSEITNELSTMSEIGREGQEEQKAFFSNIAEESTDSEADPVGQEAKEPPKVESSPAGDSPKIESSPTDSTHRSSWWRPVWLIALITFFLTAGASVSDGVRAFLYNLFKWLRTTGFIIVSFITNMLQAALSATSCSTTQYKPYFRFFGGSFMQIGFGTAIVVLIVAVLFQCGAQAASVGPSGHINASNTLLTGQRLSPLMSASAAESLLQYKDGNWLFSYQIRDLEVHAATLPNADRDYSLDWCLDSGASRHFCNDSTRFVSMKKCNISISTAKKGEMLQAIGIGDCKIAVLTANDDLVNLGLHDEIHSFALESTIAVRTKLQLNILFRLLLLEVSFISTPVLMQKSSATIARIIYTLCGIVVSGTCLCRQFG